VLLMAMDGACCKELEWRRGLGGGEKLRWTQSAVRSSGRVAVTAGGELHARGVERPIARRGRLDKAKRWTPEI
jgi:hypothetical protein